MPKVPKLKKQFAGLRAEKTPSGWRGVNREQELSNGRVERPQWPDYVGFSGPRYRVQIAHDFFGQAPKCFSERHFISASSS